ncbi:MAG: radical SAM protein [Deltaproteobacteria bacterium]|nr:radical SAM protein [Deltaproteobacteria bacterium]
MHTPLFCEWELTRACNLRCPHCSAGARARAPQELDGREALEVASQIIDIGCAAVSMTGGEPLLHPEWEAVAANLTRNGVAVSVLSNGWAIDRAMAHRLREAGVSEVVLSFDGLEALHDRVRNQPGAYRRALAALHGLRDAGVSVAVTTTLFRQTLDELPAIQELCQSLGIERWHLLLGKRPFDGIRGTMRCEFLRPADLRLLASRLRGLVCESGPQIILGDNVGSDRRSCEAGLSLFALDAEGNVKGCSAMPSRSSLLEGNVRRTELRAIWEAPQAFSYNRAFAVGQLAGKCGSCEHAAACRGGCHWSTDFASSAIDNRYCFARQVHAGPCRREAALGAAALVGLGLALTGCGHETRGANSPYGDGFSCGLEQQLKEPATPECKTLRDAIAECTMRCCMSRMVMPPDLRAECARKADEFKAKCAR